jgi:hypothetical protein
MAAIAGAFSYNLLIIREFCFFSVNLWGGKPIGPELNILKYASEKITH